MPNLSHWRGFRTLTPLDRWNAALDAEGLSPSEKLVLLEIANRDGGEGAFASVSRMARRLGVARSTIQRCLRALADKGWIAQLTHWRDRPNRYRFSSHPKVPDHAAPLPVHAAPPARSRGTEQEVEQEANGKEVLYDGEDTPHNW